MTKNNTEIKKNPKKPRMQDVPRTREELDTLHSKILSSHPPSLADLESLSAAVSLQQILGFNEILEDVNTEDLKFILSDYFLGQALLRDDTDYRVSKRNPKGRIQRIQRGQAVLDRFFLRCFKLRVYEMKEEEEGEEERFRKPPSREVKIARDGKLRGLRVELEDCSSEREKGRLRIEIACLEAENDVEMSFRELEIQEYMLKNEPEGERERGPPTVLPPLSVTRVDTAMQIKRETFQNGIFKPYHNLPTMSLEEYARLEMKQLKEREEAAALAERDGKKPILSLNELAENGFEDQDDLMEQAIEKARKWDDWKEGTPKGSGVTRRY